MITLEIRLDGYTDLPPGKIANVVTYFETFARPEPLPEPHRPDLRLRHIPEPDVGWYRTTIRTIGEPWLWFSPLVIAEAQLAAFLRNPLIEVYALERNGETVGIAELDRRMAEEVEISFFGVVESEIGTGAGRLLMNRTLEHAFREKPRRVWLHTCSFDHPAAVPFYRRAGFIPYKFAIEITDDPRLTGHLPESAAPHVALIRPRGRS
ncbi:MAG TPA: GNAT family N-acetyltransferase [Bauldia sp.]|nr:GNAT family N-acetyltransferase [Bauldia sp.]